MALLEIVIILLVTEMKFVKQFGCQFEKENMKTHKTIDKVIRKGHLMINVPVIIIMVLFPIILLIGIPVFLPEKYIGIGLIVGIFGGFGLGFVLAWTWWSFRITKWRIWV